VGVLSTLFLAYSDSHHAAAVGGVAGGGVAEHAAARSSPPAYARIRPVNQRCASWSKEW